MSTHLNPQTVLSQLKEQAERKAVLKMYYSAADVFKEYRGPYAHETAEERARLAEEYDNRGRIAEAARWGADSTVPPTAPVTDFMPASSTTSTPKPAPQKPAPPKPQVERSKPSPMLVSSTKPAAKPSGGAVEVQGGQMTFSCRWCNEPITTEAANAGKLMPCPKCDLLVTVPKPKK